MYSSDSSQVYANVTSSGGSYNSGSSSYNFTSTMVSYNYTSSTNDGDGSSSTSGDDMLAELQANVMEFGVCLNGNMVTCVDDVITYQEYDSDTCSGTAVNTTTRSHDTCYLTALSLGCSSTSECSCMNRSNEGTNERRKQMDK